jgi:FtsP/CotA-like multicopper oxidase with cupredoxin domain
LSRRRLLTASGGVLAAAAGARFLPNLGASLAAAAPANAPADVTIKMVGTDGWIYLPGSIPSGIQPNTFIQPDGYAPAPRTTYIFGFRNVTELTPALAQAQKNKAQASAPLLFLDEMDNVKISLTNLGLTQRPDLTDSHTIHFHGFRNAIPLFDGVPEMSIAVPIGRDFTYFYRPRDPGTYMYHCHFEDVEHVQMGMTGVVFVRPLQNKTPYNPGEKYVYNDGDRSTRYDREFVMFLSEVWSQAHWDDAHIQVSDWSEYHPDYFLLNGRVYPDTIAPNGGLPDPNTGLLTAPAGRPELQFQPISSLVRANAGERVLLRFVSLGYRQAAMTLGGIPMRVVGKDATLLRGRNHEDLSYETNTVYIGPGESVDAIFTAPPAASETTYQLYNRNYALLSNPGVAGLGGQLTEVRISPPGTLPAQTAPNA